MARTRWSCERIVAELRELNAAGVEMSIMEIKSFARPLYDASVRYYGSLDAALEAGLPLGGVPVTRVMGRRANAMTRDDVMHDLRERRERGENINATAIQRADRRLYNATRRHFGSVRAAFDALGE